RGRARPGSGEETAMSETEVLAWSVDGTYFEACSCLPICPCRQVGGRDGGRSTFGVCDFALSWWIRRGYSGEVDLTDRKVVMVGSYNDDEPSSPWTVALLIDDEADLAQHAALADIFLGRVGGTPSRNYSPAIQTVAGVSTAVVRLDHNRRHWRIWVGGRVDVAADEEVHSDELVACGIPGLDQPGQEVRATTLRADVEPLVWEWSDRCGFATNFAYRADR
ncbi:MAG TPA: DUF1326 domain-containing protein, partial [Acidimicrobiales bacterium]|nr:DUF1326 domain-containing protein [Acidimicrobiales bacterium]